MKMKKYEVKKVVVPGEYFIEHQYQCHPESFIGVWRKCGQTVHLNSGTEQFICRSCLSDSQNRQGNTIEANGKVYLSCDRTYSVPGVTKNFNKYPWDFGTCQNRSACWGPAVRLFTVRRRENRFQFSNLKILNPPYEEVTDKFVVTLQKVGMRDEYQHRGVAITSKYPRFIFPDLIERNPGSSYFIYVESRIRDRLPEELQYLRDIKISQWPEEYRAPNYYFPLSMKFEHFLEDPTAGNNIPSTRFQILTSHIPVARTFIDLYPGGAGFRCSQYTYLENSTFDSGLKLKPDWINEFHVSPHETYIPHQQDGFSGPIVSYWCRINHFNKWFP